MEQKSKQAVNSEEGQDKEKDPFWQRFPKVVPVLVAFFACVAPVVVAIIGSDVILNRLLVPSPTSTSTSTIVNTMTPPLSTLPALTPELPCIQNRNCPAGVDWTYSCIADYNWTIYFSDLFDEIPRDELGCYAQPILDVFYTKDNGLYIFAQPVGLISSKEYGLFTQLPQSGNVSLMLDLNDIDNGQVWIGVFENSDVHSEGVLLVAPPGDVRSQAFALKTMPTEKKVEISRIFQNPDGKYTVGFELEFGSIIASVEGVTMTPIPFTPRSRWLFIGYRAKLDNPAIGTADIQALFSNLVISE